MPSSTNQSMNNLHNTNYWVIWLRLTIYCHCVNLTSPQIRSRRSLPASCCMPCRVVAVSCGRCVLRYTCVLKTVQLYQCLEVNRGKGTTASHQNWIHSFWFEPPLHRQFQTRASPGIAWVKFWSIVHIAYPILSCGTVRQSPPTVRTTDQSTVRGRDQIFSTHKLTAHTVGVTCPGNLAALKLPLHHCSATELNNWTATSFHNPLYVCISAQVVLEAWLSFWHAKGKVLNTHKELLARTEKTVQL